MTATELCNKAAAAWTVFKDEAPSADISNTTANAVPNVLDWQDLRGTRGPMRLLRGWERRCAWPMEDHIVAEFTFLLKWEYGATYAGGGAFIPNIWIEVPHYDIFWGQHIFLSMTVRNPTNASQIPNAPLARVPVTISGTAKNPLRDLHIEWSFILYGDGTYEES